MMVFKVTVLMMRWKTVNFNIICHVFGLHYNEISNQQLDENYEKRC